MASYRKTGVDEARREEIRRFLVERFTEFHKTATKVRCMNYVLDIGVLSLCIQRI